MSRLIYQIVFSLGVAVLFLQANWMAGLGTGLIAFGISEGAVYIAKHCNN